MFEFFYITLSLAKLTSTTSILSKNIELFGKLLNGKKSFGMYLSKKKFKKCVFFLKEDRIIEDKNQFIRKYSFFPFSQFLIKIIFLFF